MSTTRPKPDELLALHDVSAELFAILQRWFDVPARVSFDVATIDSAVREMSDPTMVAAFAMRKLQAVHLLATPGVRTTTDVVLTILSDLERALTEAPATRLRMVAARTDWDRAFEAMEAAGEQAGDAPLSADEDDPEIAEFRLLHGRMHQAARAVLEASEGEIRVFE